MLSLCQTVLSNFSHDGVLTDVTRTPVVDIKRAEMPPMTLMTDDEV